MPCSCEKKEKPSNDGANISLAVKRRGSDLTVMEVSFYGQVTSETVFKCYKILIS